VSVIIPTHNQKFSLSRAIDSVINQTTMQWELLIIDDGSDDGTEKFIKDYFLLNKKIRYFRREYNGIVAAKNFGLKNAIGSYITFLDPEDEFLPSHLELRLRFMQTNTHVDLIHGGAVILQNDKIKSCSYSEKETDQTKTFLKKFIGSTIFGKRKVFEFLSGFRNVDDYDKEFVEKAFDYFNIQRIDFPTYIVHKFRSNG